MIPRRKPKILVCAPIHRDAVALLRTVADVRVVDGRAWAHEDAGDEIANLDAIVASYSTQLPVAVIERGARLRVIGRTGNKPDTEAPAAPGEGTDTGSDAAAYIHGVQIVQAPNHNGVVGDELTLRDAEIAVCEEIVQILRRNYTIDGLPLQVVPVEQVIAHENFDGRRAANLADRLVADGRLVNPPVTIRQGRHYVVLDGATRLTAFRQLRYPYIVVQEVDLSRVDVALDKWNHAVHGGRPEMLVQLLATIPGLTMVADGDSKADEQLTTFGEGGLGYFCAADGQTFRLETAGDLPAQQWLDVLNRTVHAYSAWGIVERTLDRDMVAFGEQYPDLAGLFVFPTMRLEMLLGLATAGQTMPAGITRFKIPGRILHLNAPLERLRRRESLVEKRQWLENLVHERIVQRKVRHYEEPVVLLDE